MFMQIAVAAIGIAIVLMVGYLIIAQVSINLPTQSQEATDGIASAKVTIFAGFGLVAVGIIVLAAFAMINIFR